MAKLLREIVEKKLSAPKESQSNKANVPTDFAGKKSSKTTAPDIDDKNFYNWEGGKDGVAFIKKHKTETHDYPDDAEAAFKGKKGGMKKADHKTAPQDTYEEVEQIDEKLKKSMSAGEVISDFVHSDDPKFAGKSKKERMRMALGAYYSINPSKSRKKMEEAATCNMSEAGKMCEVHGEGECPGYRAERKGGRKLLLGGKKKMEEGVMDTIKDRIKDPNPPEKYTPKFETDPKKKNPNTGSSPSPEDREALEKKSKDATNEATDPNLAVTMIESGKKSKKKMKNEQAAPYDGGIVPNPTGASYSSIGRDGAV